ncbi:MULTISPECIES: type I polyketide synthase [unclassified Tolypothrix]|uniref:type I polyketide synthase n=1 Tax=unclassified Tolypothrix TaxID=2649714 RepID=UPI0005EAC226|nr:MULTISPECIES: type I polyketide synthase [unclassified Tolypothrix]EKF04532.1 beta-ketoacyl synthase protein [Tolypothrix sp. PCC 7601]MBE9080967.1 type I polyketide synthase [Tolypothrix sp. LEGE 11397]UYD32352.1 type I polyketide synthase [Tolypothrix sp. PCC 7601]BAY91345.1 beta ketoacyl-acyl carrier protein synthase [Microchaete diplosiphon NIES-3275]
MKPAITIVGMACQYPDARSPAELWENVLAGRRAFRRIPSDRLRLEDYFSSDHNTPDATYATQAALIEGYEFDRVGFRVAGSTYRCADLVHWLALDVATQALADAGFPQGQGLPRQTTGVVLGNTLTGEFSRTNLLRLRWPYVHRVVEAALVNQNWPHQQRQEFLQALETQYKAPFPPVGEETLAGNLSNTIAGRICNYYDLKGGGYTVDGACSASLLAVATACSALVNGDLDVALVGGVDVSIDPFEIIGFAKAGALATEEMRVYDARSAGFIPGEGCGFAVLMRDQDAVDQHRRIYSLIRGWGISSDGNGGMTRPEVEGQLLAVQRAYTRAGFGIDTVAYFEGHGTGTTVGDATELQVLSRARREVGEHTPPAAIGSIKANIGHTKAAAGIAGLIKATLAIHNQVLPPTTGCEQPHPELTGEHPALRRLTTGELWSLDAPLRAGVSAMGFGGINTHIVLEGVASDRRQNLSPQERVLLSSAQDAELLLLGAEDTTQLQQQVERLLSFAAKLSRSELTDLAAQLAHNLGNSRYRAAILAINALQLEASLKTLHSWLDNGVTTRLDADAGIFLGIGTHKPSIGFLFPGQGSPIYLNGGAWERRFASVRSLYEQANLPQDSCNLSTLVAQPAIVTASMAALPILETLGVKANMAIGHSLGELTALHWAGAFDQATLLRIATVRGRAMATLGSSTGAMASIQAAPPLVEELILDTGPANWHSKAYATNTITHPTAIAGFNSPRQTVISGEATAVAAIVAKAQALGLKVVQLPVSHAFHSPLVAAAAQPLANHLVDEEIHSLQRLVVSTVTGSPLAYDADLRELLYRQVTSPVRFMEAVSNAVADVDLWLEVGPGRVLSGLVSELVDTLVIPLDVSSNSLKGLLQAVAAAFVLGTPIHHKALFADRFTRSLSLDWQPKFFANPCELAPLPESVTEHISTENEASHPEPIEATDRISTNSELSACDLVRQLVAERAELPLCAVNNDSRLLSDLHLNSITVGQLVAQAARCLGLSPPVALTNYADATVSEIVQALAELAQTGKSVSTDNDKYPPSGIDAWIRPFTVELVERTLPHRHFSPNAVGTWQIIAPPEHPLANSLQEAFNLCEGNGVVVCLPPQPDVSHIHLLLTGARIVLAKTPTQFVLVQHDNSGGGFARTLHLEASNLTTCVVNVPINHPQAAKWVLAEAKAAIAYSEAHYDDLGRRHELMLKVLPQLETSTELPLKSDDVLLVTGGGKGITAECAFSLAKDTGVRLVLLGRSQPDQDPELLTNLDRMTAAGIEFRYIATDITDAVAVRSAIQTAEAAFGSISAILHGAARNVPQRLSNLDQPDFLQTLAPKVQGLENVLAAVNPDHLRLLIAFGSIIARTGLPGEADYALANEWLVRLVERWQADHPDCRCLTIEWSIWSEVGMGSRLGSINTLLRQGITPISTDRGIAMLYHLLTQPFSSNSTIVTGRCGGLPTLQLEQPDLPLRRFLEQPQIYYPGVELVADATLSTATDLYLNDHQFQGERVFPAVLGLEAMAQVAMALARTEQPPMFEQVKFDRPVVVSESTPLKIRIVALMYKPGHIEVALRSEQTAFGVDHFRATCWMGKQESEIGQLSTHAPKWASVADFVTLNPNRDLYGRLLFHQGRFQRLSRYRQLRAKECLAEIAPDQGSHWFSSYLPAHLVLGDPAARDAAVHALQACIPQATLLPIAVERLELSSLPSTEPQFVYAKERSHDGDTFIYDLEIFDRSGQILERWQGLQIKVIHSTELENPWVESLLGPYLERRIQQLVPLADITVIVDCDPAVERRVRSDRAIQQAIGSKLPIWRRSDGKPEVLGGQQVSVSHTEALTIAVAGQGAIGCDVEPVVPRPVSVWQDLLGTERFKLAQIIHQEWGEDQNTGATRIWTAIECLKKAGAISTAPLILVNSRLGNDQVLLESGNLQIFTFGISVQTSAHKLVFAVLLNKQ